MSIRTDSLLRMIQELDAAHARIAGLHRDGRLEEAMQEIESARRALFGPVAELLPQLDPESAAHLLGGTDRILAWVRLTHAEAELHRAGGGLSTADARRRQTFDLLSVARARAPEDADRIDELLGSIAPGTSGV